MHPALADAALAAVVAIAASVVLAIVTPVVTATVAMDCNGRRSGNSCGARNRRPDHATPTCTSWS
jgi:hypothetical protein